MSATLRGFTQRAFGLIATLRGSRLTFLAAFLLACAGASANAQVTNGGGVTDLGSVNIGAAASTATVTFNVAAGQTATPTSVSAVSLGDILQDFSIPSQTCVGVTLNGPATCTVTVAFAPSARGSRRGAVILTAPNQANVVVYLHGTGVGSQLVFSPDTASTTGTVTPLQPNNYSPSTVVFDAAGNLYFNDILNSRILEQSASGTLATVAVLPGTIMSSLAISGDGTIFATVPSQAAIYAIVPGAPNKTLLTSAGYTLNHPSGIAVDADSSIYIADAGSNKIIHAVASGGGGYVTLNGLAKPLSGPEGIALDGMGNLFIADTGNARIVEVNLNTGAATPVTITGATLYNPYGITLDASGTLYIADTGNRRIVRVLPSGVATAIQTSNFTFATPTGVTLAANGDLVVADNASGLTRIFRTSPTPTITFPTATNVGTLDSSDGPLSVTLQNIGNAPLQLVLPNQATPNPRTTTAAFAVSPTSTCPLAAVGGTAASAQIAAGTACTYAVTFTPTAAGTNTASLNILSRPTGSTANVTSAITLVGTGIGTNTPPATVDTFSITAPATATIGTPISFTITAMLNGAVDTAYAGTITLTTGDAKAVFGSGTTYTFTAADAGTHTFTAPANGITFGTAGTFAITATAGMSTGTSNNIVVSAVPTAANVITFTITPTATVGVADAFTLTVTQGGAVNTAYRGTVTLSSTDPLATFPGGTIYTFTAADAGTHSFPTGVVFGTVGTFAVSATDGTVTGIANVIVSATVTPPPAPNNFALTITPTATVGVADPFTLTITANGAPNTAYRGTVTFTATDPLETFPNGTTYTFTAADAGQHTFPAGVIFGSVGTFMVSASDGTAIANATVVVSAATPPPPTPNNFALTITPTATVGVADPFTLTVTTNGATNTAYRGTVTFTTTDPLAAFPGGTTYTFTAADAGQHTFPAGVIFGSVGTFMVSATDGTANANAIVVVSAAGTAPTPANTIAFTITPTATDGVADAFTLTVTQNGATNTAYRGTVTFNSTDPLATFPGGTTYTFTAADAGAHTFFTGVVFGSVGTFTVSASDGTATGLTNVIVSAANTPPAPANKFALTITPTATVGVADPFTLTVSANGATNTAYRGTVTFNATDPLATFPAGTTYTFTAADNGTHTFPAGVIFGTVGTFTVSASDGTANANANVVVSAAGTGPVAPNAFAFTITPTATVGVGDAFTLSVTANGAPNTAYRGTVTLSSTDPLATFPAGTTYTFTAADAGSHTFPVGVVFGTAGTFLVNATDGTANAAATVLVSAAVTPTPNNTLTFTITPTATIGVPDAFTLSVTQNGAAATGYRGTVTLSSTDPLATFPGGTVYTFTAADAGTHTFATGVVFGTAGTFAVNATDGASNATTNVVVSAATTTPPAVVNTFAITTTPTATVGVADAFTLTVTANGVPATGYTGAVTLSSTDPLAKFPGGATYTFTAADAGTHTFAAGIVFGTVGTFTIHATDGTAAATANVVVAAAGTPPPPTLVTPTIALTSSVNPITVGGSTTLSAIVTGTAVGGVPTGSIGFFDNGAPLGVVNVMPGTGNTASASLPVTFATTGTHNLTATYTGSTVYNPVTSAIVAETVGDITLTLTPNTPATVTVLPGNSASFSFTVSPANNGTFALPVTFSASGLPKGATATFSPASVAAGAQATAFTLTIAVPVTSAAQRQAPAGDANPSQPSGLSRMAPAFLALALLPLLSRRRRKLFLPMLALMGMTFGALATTGCIADQASGYFGETPQTYSIVVTATSGATTRSTTVTLIVQ